MNNYKKIKELSAKLAESLLEEEISSDFEEVNVFDEKIKKRVLEDIKDGTHLELLKSIDTEKDWKSLKPKLKGGRKKALFWLYTIAASVIVVFGVGLFLINGNYMVTQKTTIITRSTIKVGTDKATLTLENGTHIVLGEGHDYVAENLSSNGHELIYTPTREAKVESAYNILTIPRGGQFFVKLSDGTQVWLNSESQLKYPVAFETGKTRNVELVYGEAYFDVSSSTGHQGAVFRVRSQSQSIEVLGTEFNVKAYKDEVNTYTTLVEGKVVVRVGEINKVLEPSQQSNLNHLDNTIQMTRVDVYNETAWKEGEFNFKRKPLKDIMKVLSRWYDMDVVFADKSLEDIGFIGAFKKNSAIEDVLLIIKNTGFVKGYSFEGKTLTIY